jgi:TolA-binding protein
VRYPDNNDLEGEAHESTRHPIHWPSVFGAVLLIGLLGVGAGAWYYGESQAAKLNPSAAAQEAYVPSKDFERYQQTATADIQDTKNKLQEQDTQIRQMSEQIAQLNVKDAQIRQMSEEIAQLNVTLDVLQTVAREAQGSVQLPAGQKTAKKH